MEQDFDRIDVMIDRIISHKTDELAYEVAKRATQLPNFERSDHEILRICIEAIAFSQGSRSKDVRILIDAGILERIFNEYEDIEAIASMNPAELLTAYWSQLGALRWPKKVASMVMCAKAFVRIRKRFGSLMQCLASAKLPTPLQSAVDLNLFWDGFRRVQSDFQDFEMPFFDKLTSLCHLLQLIGYDCAKPDSAVMKAASTLQIVATPSGKNYKDRERRHVVMTMQRFCIARELRVPVLDLYFLIAGRQTGATSCVIPKFYDS